MLKQTKHHLTMAAKGFCMGMADIIPGVSGGTMAYILGIYERFLAAIRSFDIGLLREVLRGEFSAIAKRPDWALIIPLGVGILSALIVFTKIIPLPHLLLTYPTYVYALFFGLVGGSVLVLLTDVKPLIINDILWLAVGASFGYIIATQVPATTPDAAWFIFLCGMLAISAMLLPGVSGAFILLMMGKYGYILDAASQFNLSVLLPLLAGMVTGIIIFSRIIGWLLDSCHRISIMVINGILLGSLRLLYPFQERLYSEVHGKSIQVAANPIMPSLADSTTLWAGLLIVIGFLIVVAMHRISKPPPSSK